jgi:hypothetical protein
MSNRDASLSDRRKNLSRVAGCEGLRDENSSQICARRLSVVCCEIDLGFEFGIVFYVVDVSIELCVFV